MHRDTISADLETMEEERNFEQNFGREMTREEKRLFALSAHLAPLTPEVESFPPAERRSNLRIMPIRTSGHPDRRVA